MQEMAEEEERQRKQDERDGTHTSHVARFFLCFIEANLRVLQEKNKALSRLRSSIFVLRLFFLYDVRSLL